MTPQLIISCREARYLQSCFHSLIISAFITPVPLALRSSTLSRLNKLRNILALIGIDIKD